MEKMYPSNGLLTTFTGLTFSPSQVEQEERQNVEKVPTEFNVTEGRVNLPPPSPHT